MIQNFKRRTIILTDFTVLVIDSLMFDYFKTKLNFENKYEFPEEIDYSVSESSA